MELLRIYPLTVQFLRKYIGPRLTKKERRLSYGILHPLECPPDFWHAETFAQLILFYMISFVYSPIAPITSVVLCFCFLLLESGYRYQFVHNYPKAHDSGGRIWKFFITFTLISMVIAQLTLIGILSLKQSHYAGPAMGPLFAITILFILFINDQHAKVSEFLPTRDCILKDSENMENPNFNMNFVKNAYLQPSLRNSEPIEPDYEDL
jgi:calcium permeable stress-gated cation channel